MIKNQATLHPVGAEMVVHAAIAPASFLFSRQHVTRLTGLDLAGSARYVWREVFLRGKKVM